MDELEDFHTDEQIYVFTTMEAEGKGFLFPSRKHAYIILTPINPTFI